MLDARGGFYDVRLSFAIIVVSHLPKKPDQAVVDEFDAAAMQ